MMYVYIYICIYIYMSCGCIVLCMCVYIYMYLNLKYPHLPSIMGERLWVHTFAVMFIVQDLPPIIVTVKNLPSISTPGWMLLLSCMTNLQADQLCTHSQPQAQGMFILCWLLAKILAI